MPDQLLEGLVVKEQSGFYWVETPDGTIYRCQLRGRLKEEAQSTDIAAIGDRVQFAPIEEEGVEVLQGVIESVQARTSVLARAVRTEGKRGAGQAERQHVIIANADQAFFVFAARQPTPNLQMLDRWLVSGEHARIERLFIVINKIDLEDPGNIAVRFAPYEKMGYPILYTSARDGSGVDELARQLVGHISVFTGPSGVGKTSLLNRIQPDLGRAVKAVSKNTEQGMHTTRDSALIKLDKGGYIADTPGIRVLNIWDVEPDELDGYFRDIAQYIPHCKFRDCKHINEPDCAVIAAVKAGHIARTRYNNYRSLRNELKETYIVY